jgi:glucan phosphoethanolaminetransferase (alkaline phosphatase superfamily)
MKSIKKLFGIVCLVLAPILIYMMFNQFTKEIPLLQEAIKLGKKPASDIQSTYIFWIITITIFVPIALGLSLLGWYAIKGEYENLNATEI